MQNQRVVDISDINVESTGNQITGLYLAIFYAGNKTPNNTIVPDYSQYLFSCFFDIFAAKCKSLSGMYILEMKAGGQGSE